MTKVTFVPGSQKVEVEPNTKLLVAARRHKIPIRFGCASCACGTCAVLVTNGQVSPMEPGEKALLQKMTLPTDGSVRLSCQARVTEEDIEVDLDFQNRYSPDTGMID